MTSPFRVACIQVTSGTRIVDNIEKTEALIRAAAADGAQLVGLPEVVNLMQIRRRPALEEARTQAAEPSLAAYKALARELKIWIHMGSLVIKLEDDDRFANRAFLIDDNGMVVATYDKIHMFDVDLEGGESYRESEGFRPGDRAVVADTPWCRYGLSVCYDLRFPHLYRALAHAGAQVLSIPAAFTRKTGQAHWHTLIRARAIENGCFAIAPAQCGDHEDGRQTFGHALIVAPWGEVLADGGEEEGFIAADLDLSLVDKARGMVPAIHNDRKFAPPQVSLAEAGE